MDRARGPAPAIRAGSLALITAFLGMAGLSLAGCHVTSPRARPRHRRPHPRPGHWLIPGQRELRPVPSPGTHQATARSVTAKADVGLIHGLVVSSHAPPPWGTGA